jgi:hypothetical protein
MGSGGDHWISFCADSGIWQMWNLTGSIAVRHAPKSSSNTHTKMPLTNEGKRRFEPEVWVCSGRAQKNIR